MVMKDKLEKTNRKRNYYLKRNILFSLAALVLLGGSISIPTYISISNNTVKKANAEVETVDTNTSENTLNLETY